MAESQKIDIQDSMPQYLAEEKNEEGILAMMNGNFKDYQEWKWNVFAKYAYLETIGLNFMLFR